MTDPDIPSRVAAALKNKTEVKCINCGTHLEFIDLPQSYIIIQWCDDCNKASKLSRLYCLNPEDNNNG
jgi:hypothetical protein